MEIVAGAYPGKCLFAKKISRELAAVDPGKWAAVKRKLSNSRRTNTQSRWCAVSPRHANGGGQQSPAPRAPVMCAQPRLRVPARVGTLILRAGAARAVLSLGGAYGWSGGVSTMAQSESR